MMKRILLVCLAAAFTNQVRSQTCTCDALNSCTKSSEDSMTQCHNQCKTGLKAAGQTCYDQHISTMQATKTCVCNSGTATDNSQNQFPGPFGGQGGGPGGFPGSGGPGGPGGFPGGRGGGMFNFFGNSDTELGKYDTCFFNCISNGNSNPMQTFHQCERNLRCNHQNCRSQFEAGFTSLCTCLKGAYTDSEVPPYCKFQ